MDERLGPRKVEVIDDVDKKEGGARTGRASLPKAWTGLGRALAR